MNGPQQPNVDLSAATDVICSCGNFTFQEVVLIKHLSAIASPTGQAGYVPIPTFSCNACGIIPSQFLPAHMKKDDIKSSDVPASKSHLTLIK